MAAEELNITAEKIVATTRLEGLDEVIEVLEDATRQGRNPMMQGYAVLLLSKVREIYAESLGNEQEIEPSAPEERPSFGAMLYELASLNPEDILDKDLEEKVEALIEHYPGQIKSDLIAKIQDDYDLDFATYYKLAKAAPTALTAELLFNGAIRESRDSNYTAQERLEILGDIYSYTASFSQDGKESSKVVNNEISRVFGFTIDQVESVAAATEARALQTISVLTKLFKTIELPKGMKAGKPASCGTIHNAPTPPGA